MLNYSYLLIKKQLEKYYKKSHIINRKDIEVRNKDEKSWGLI